MLVSLLIQKHITIEVFKPKEMTATTMGTSRFLLQCAPASRSGFSYFSTFAFDCCHILDSPGPASFENQERAGFSPFWWGRGCPGACRATASAAAPCPAEPDACVSLSPRWDDPYREEKHHRPGKKRTQFYFSAQAL